MKKNIAVIFGGDSPESDISIITAVQAMAAVDKTKFKIFPLLMQRGEFCLCTELKNVSEIRSKNKQKAAIVGQSLLVKQGFKYKKQCDIDCALLCTHGGSGENGALQGLLECSGIPYTSAGVAESAILMNKLYAKQIFSELRLKQVPYTSFCRDEFEKDSEKTLERIEKELPYPLIVKPASLGSSIGIKTATDREELVFAAEVALEFDDTVVVEKKLTDFVEVNCAAVKDGKKVVVSSIEKPIGWEDFLSFNDKYTSGKMSGLSRELPAKIPDTHTAAVKKMTEKIFNELALKGVVRMDFLIDGNDNIFINEVNTIPGSLAFYLFEDIGISYENLISILIETAITSSKNAEKLKKHFSSSVLEKYRGGVKGTKG